MQEFDLEQEIQTFISRTAAKNPPRFNPATPVCLSQLRIYILALVYVMVVFVFNDFM